MNPYLIEQYRQLHRMKPGYGAGVSGLPEISEIIGRGKIRTILDFGCGRGALANELRRRFPGCVVDAYDPAMPGLSVIPRERYDLVIANDVLEHLDPDNYGEELSAIAALRPEWLFFNISCRPAVNLLPDGSNCHTLVRPASWWKEELAARFPGHVEFNSAWDGKNRSLALSMALKLDLTGQRVAVIGNGPHALENVEEIDAFDVVVRFNRFQLGASFEALGSRTDIWATYLGRVAEEATKRTLGGARMILVLERRPVTRGQSRRHVAKLGKLAALRSPLAVLEPSGIVERLETELGIRPTTGCGAIAWLLEQKPAEIYLTGFSFETGGPDHYFPDPQFPFSDVHHSRTRELEWLAKRAADPVLRFDAHIRRKLAELPPDAAAAAG